MAKKVHRIRLRRAANLVRGEKRIPLNPGSVIVVDDDNTAALLMGAGEEAGEDAEENLIPFKDPDANQPPEAPAPAKKAAKKKSAAA